MKIIKWKFGGVAPKIDKNISIAIGNFDGIHQGHVKLLETAKLNALENNLAFGVVTFDPHPRDFFSSGNSSFKLLDALEKENLLREIGVNYLIIIEFNEELKNCSANDFLSKILNETFKVTKMFAGSNFRFGKNRAGDVKLLKKREDFFKYKTRTVSPLNKKNLIISSTLIRNKIKNGKIEYANKLLGRSWTIEGVVHRGDRRGRTIGCPTCNIDIKNYIVPKLGVYSAKILIGNKTNKKGIAPL